MEQDNKAACELIAVGGLSGSGKSTLIRYITEHMKGDAAQVAVISTDVVRKNLWGCPVHEELPPEAYSREFSQKTYQEVDRLTNEALGAGKTVFVDAVFATEFGRAKVQEAAENHGAAFTGIWLQAPVDTIKQRADARVGDASDATSEIIDLQLSFNLGDIKWHVVDAGQSVEHTARQVQKWLPENLQPDHGGAEAGPDFGLPKPQVN